MDEHEESRIRQQEQHLRATDERLRAAVQFTVGKICEENHEMTFSREFISQLGQLTFDFLSDTWAKDLELFARHAKRTSVNVEDVKLLVRNNPSLLAMLTEESDAIMAAATVQKEQSAKRRQIKRDEGERASPLQPSPQKSSPPKVLPKPEPSTTPAAEDLNDDSLDGIDWDAFDQPIASKPNENRAQATSYSASTKADAFNTDSDLDGDFQQPSTSRAAYLDSTRLPASNWNVSKFSQKDRSLSPPLNRTTVSPLHSIERNTTANFTPGYRSNPKSSLAKNANESGTKRRSEDKAKNTSMTTSVKKAKISSDNNRSIAASSAAAYDSFDDDDDFV